MKKNFDWSTIDWKLTTDDIVKQLKCCASTVRKRRREFAPETVKLQNRGFGPRGRRTAKLNKISAMEAQTEDDAPFLD